MKILEKKRTRIQFSENWGSKREGTKEIADFLIKNPHMKIDIEFINGTISNYVELTAEEVDIVLTAPAWSKTTLMSGKSNLNMMLMYHGGLSLREYCSSTDTLNASIKLIPEFSSIGSYFSDYLIDELRGYEYTHLNTCAEKIASALYVIITRGRKYLSGLDTLIDEIDKVEKSSSDEISNEAVEQCYQYYISMVHRHGFERNTLSDTILQMISRLTNTPLPKKLGGPGSADTFIDFVYRVYDLVFPYIGFKSTIGVLDFKGNMKLPENSVNIFVSMIQSMEKEKAVALLIKYVKEIQAISPLSKYIHLYDTDDPKLYVDKEYYDLTTYPIHMNQWIVCTMNPIRRRINNQMIRFMRDTSPLELAKLPLMKGEYIIKFHNIQAKNLSTVAIMCALLDNKPEFTEGRGAVSPLSKLIIYSLFPSEYRIATHTEEFFGCTKSEFYGRYGKTDGTICSELMFSPNSTCSVKLPMHMILYHMSNSSINPSTPFVHDDVLFTAYICTKFMNTRMYSDEDFSKEFVNGNLTKEGFKLLSELENRSTHEFNEAIDKAIAFIHKHSYKGTFDTVIPDRNAIAWYRGIDKKFNNIFHISPDIISRMRKDSNLSLREFVLAIGKSNLDPNMVIKKYKNHPPMLMDLGVIFWDSEAIPNILKSIYNLEHNDPVFRVKPRTQSENKYCMFPIYINDTEAKAALCNSEYREKVIDYFHFLLGDGDTTENVIDVIPNN